MRPTAVPQSGVFRRHANGPSHEASGLARTARQQMVRCRLACVNPRRYCVYSVPIGLDPSTDAHARRVVHELIWPHLEYRIHKEISKELNSYGLITLLVVWIKGVKFTFFIERNVFLHETQEPKASTPVLFFSRKPEKCICA